MSVVVTTFPIEDYELYGKKFISTFTKHWPKDYRLIVYTDEMVDVPRGECILIKDACPAIQQFIDRNKDDPKKCGREKVKGWKAKHIQKGYNYKFDSIKWVYQAMVPYYAYTRHVISRNGMMAKSNDEYFIWMDGDVYTKRKISKYFIPKLLDGHSIAYLGRENTHTECGFIAFSINPSAGKLIFDWFKLFASDEIFKKPYWNSAHAFDYALEYSTSRRVGDPLNLTPGLNGHVWHKCILGTYMDHLKGNRKELGYSPEGVSNGTTDEN